MPAISMVRTHSWTRLPARRFKDEVEVMFMQRCCYCGRTGLRSGARPVNLSEISPFLDSGDRATAALSRLCTLRIGTLVVTLHCSIASQTSSTRPYRQIIVELSIY